MWCLAIKKLAEIVSLYEMTRTAKMDEGNTDPITCLFYLSSFPKSF